MRNVIRKFLWGARFAYVAISSLASSIITRIRFYLLGVRAYKGLNVSGWLKLNIHPTSSVNIGAYVRLNSGHDRNFVGGHQRLGIHVGPGARLVIGDEVGISNSTIICFNQITIDRAVFIGGGCCIFDTDFHPLTQHERLKFDRRFIKTAPVTIEEGSFIGGHAIILKGVRIGRAAVVGAGSVITKDIPAGEIWAGNPARKVGVVSDFEIQ